MCPWADSVILEVGGGGRGRSGWRCKQPEFQASVVPGPYAGRDVTACAPVPVCALGTHVCEPSDTEKYIQLLQ